MKRLVRILLVALSVVSLLLCAAVVAVYVRSYFVAETFDWVSPRRDGMRHVYWVRGRIGLAVQTNAMTPAQMRMMNVEFNPPAGVQYRRQGAEHRRDRPDDLEPGWSWFRPTADRGWGGFRYRAGRLGVFSNLRQWVVPFWALAAVLGPAGAIALLHLRRRLREWRMRGENRCVGCGYDLRATPDRCPECGRTVASDNVAV